MFDYWRIKRCCLSYWYIFVAIVEGAPDQLYPNYGGYFTVVEIISVMFIITVITMLSRHSTPSASSQLSDPRQRGILSPKCAFHPCRKPWLSRLVWWKIFQNIGLSQMFPQKKNWEWRSQAENGTNRFAGGQLLLFQGSFPKLLLGW